MDRTGAGSRMSWVCGAGIALGVSIFLVSGCSSRAPEGPSAATEGGSEIAETTSIDAAMNDANAYQVSQPMFPSRVLAASEGASLGLELVDGDGFNVFKISAPKADDAALRYEVSRLESPARLVVDIYGKNLSTSKVFETADSALISRVRVGSHSDRSRVVLDLAPTAVVEHRVDAMTAPAAEGEFEEISITIAAQGDLERSYAAWASSANVNPQTASLGDIAVLEDSESDEARAAYGAEDEAATPIDETTEQAAIEEEPAFDVAANNDEGAEVSGSRILALSLDSVSATENMLVAQVSSDATYMLSRTAPSEYVLKLPGSDLDETAAQTLVSPMGSGKIRTVRPVKEGNDVLVRIFTTPTTSLEARASQGKIVVTASDMIDEARAQMEPESTPDAKVEVKEAADTSGGDIDLGVAALLGEQPKYTGRLISLDLQDTDIDNALRIIAEVSNLNIIASDDVTGKVTLRLIDVPWDQALDVILKTNGLDKVQEGNVVRIAPVEKLRLEREALKQAQQAEEELEPLSVRYLRVSYAKAAEMQPLVEGVLSERGAVSYDERTNQLIVKDIRKGVKNVVELVSKLDLRTPQILLETQIVEANRNLLRSLGTDLDFNFVRSPETGNPTGYNFPNTVETTGVTGFPANVDPSLGGSVLEFLLESADGTKQLTTTLTALENEGRVRIVSRPAVATTNNTAATIKSVEKIRIKTPSGGVSVATGQGANAAGSSSTATESVEIGIVLNVTPQASPDYYVLLDIDAKSSTFGSREVDGIPSEVERSATSSVLVSSGQTFAMGGIYRIIDREGLTGVPFLKDVPVLGHLFRRQNTDNSDEELIFFVTPRIIEGSFDDAAMKVSL